MSKFRRWMPSILCLLAVWLVVSLAVRLVSSGKPSVAGTLELLAVRPAAAGNAQARRAWIDLLASRLSALDLDSRHRVLMDSRLRLAFLEMSSEDQSYFLQVTETPGMREFIEGSKGWSVGRYERLVQPALADLENLKTGSTARFEALLADPAKWEIGEGGIETIFKDTSSFARFDTRPLVERIQKYSQMGR